MARINLHNIKFDYAYATMSWDFTFNKEDMDSLEEYYIKDEVNPGVVEIQTLIEGPVIYAVEVVIERDADGDADECAIQYFDNQFDAEKAAQE